MISPVVKSQSNINKTLVYFGLVSQDKWNLMAKLDAGNIYYNTSNSSENPEWTALAKYNNTFSILDLDNVAIMKFNIKDSTLGCLSGKYSATQEYKGSDPDEEAIQRKYGQMQTTYMYTQGYQLIKSGKLYALAQFCGGQKFIIMYNGKKENNSYYAIKSPPNYFEDYSYDNILDQKPNIVFWVKNSTSTRLDFSIIFFMMKFAKQDINPCE